MATTDTRPTLIVPDDPMHEALRKAQQAMSLDERIAFLMRLAGRDPAAHKRPASAKPQE